MARHLRKRYAQGGAGKVRHIVDTPLELLQKATGGVLYVGDVLHLVSKNIKRHRVHAPGQADRYNVRIIAANSRGNEGAVQDGRLLELLSKTVVATAVTQSAGRYCFLVNQIVTELADTQKINRSNSAAARWPYCVEYEWPGIFRDDRGVVFLVCGVVRVWHWGRTAAKWKSRKSARLWAGLRNRFLPKSSAVQFQYAVARVARRIGTPLFEYINAGRPEYEPRGTKDWSWSGRAAASSNSSASYRAVREIRARGQVNRPDCFLTC